VRRQGTFPRLNSRPGNTPVVKPNTDSNEMMLGSPAMTGDESIAGLREQIIGTSSPVSTLETVYIVLTSIPANATVLFPSMVEDHQTNVSGRSPCYASPHDAFHLLILSKGFNVLRVEDGEIETRIYYRATLAYGEPGEMLIAAQSGSCESVHEALRRLLDRLARELQRTMKSGEGWCEKRCWDSDEDDVVFDGGLVMKKI